MTDRRSVLAALAALGTASLASAPRVFGQPRSVKLDVRGGAIDAGTDAAARIISSQLPAPRAG